MTYDFYEIRACDIKKISFYGALRGPCQSTVGQQRSDDEI